MIGRSDAREIADRATQIHVIPCNEHAPASSAKRVYAAAVFRRQAVPDIDREQPQLIVVASIKLREKAVGSAERIAVPHRHLE